MINVILVRQVRNNRFGKRRENLLDATFTTNYSMPGNQQDARVEKALSGCKYQLVIGNTSYITRQAGRKKGRRRPVVYVPLTQSAAIFPLITALSIVAGNPVSVQSPARINFGIDGCGPSLSLSTGCESGAKPRCLTA